VTGRITTRAGRKIRHVAPGHVVDVATGIEVRQTYTTLTNATRWQIGRTSQEWTRLDRALGSVARAEAGCALVRGMLAIGGLS
jgi:hypothetical protein